MKNDSVFCSIIIPVYNSAAYLKKCMESILSQKYKNFEVILVDDGSTDESGKWCDYYATNNNNVFVIHKENGGHTSARNAGLKKASGQYVAFVDSDDWLDDTLLEDCFSVAEDVYPDVILYGYRRVFCGLTEEKLQPYKQGFYNRKKIKEEILPTLLVSGHFSLCERMIKRHLVNQYQPMVDSRILLGEDLVCCVATICSAESVYVLEQAYYNYFQHQSSVVHSYKNYTFSNWMLVRNQLDQFIGDKLPDYEMQRGVCSIRFLQRAVLGVFSKENLGIGTAVKIRLELGYTEYVQDIENALIPRGRKALRFKHFCLKHKMVYTIYFSDWVVQKIRRK